MAEQQNGGICGNWLNDDSGGTAEWQIGYVPNLPDIFTVDTDDDDTDTDTDTDTF